MGAGAKSEGFMLVLLAVGFGLVGTAGPAGGATERHAGQSYEVIDMAALFRRHPDVCLIDGLASDDELGAWVELGIGYARSLPPK